jgi:DNA-binding MarR family transcriptional regulator
MKRTADTDIGRPSKVGKAIRRAPRRRVAAPPARPARATGQLDPSLMSVLQAAAAWEERLETALSTVGLSTSKFVALRHLANAGEPLTLSELADRTACVRSNITQVVDRLEADALAERVDDSYDRRMIRAQLTPLGHERYRAGAKLVDAVSAEFAAALGAPDRLMLGRLLSRLR